MRRVGVKPKRKAIASRWPLLLAFVLGGTLSWFGRGRWQQIESGRQQVSVGQPEVVPLLGQPTSQEKRSGSSAGKKQTAADVVRELAQGYMGGEIPSEQLESYLRRHERNAESLLAAYELTQEDSLLKEAAERFPDDPRVLLRVAMHEDSSFPGRDEALDRLIELQPDNAVGPIVKAGRLAKEKKTDEAIDLLRESLKRGQFLDYRKERNLARQEALLSMGKSSVFAKSRALSVTDSPYLNGIKLASKAALDQAKELTKSGQQEAADELTSVVFAVGKKFYDRPQATLLDQAFANGLQQMGLQAMPPDAELGGTGKTVADGLAELDKEKGLMKDLTGTTGGIFSPEPAEDPNSPLQNLDATMLELYMERVAQLGERNAMLWLKSVTQGK